jgi:DHA2 family multidrug resistance protein
VDRRLVITVGLTLFAFSLWLSSHMTSLWGFDEMFWPQALRGLAVMLCIVPTVGMALSSFQGPQLRNASGLFNLMRNLGGAIGIAVVNTWLQDSTRIGAARLGEALGRDPAGATGAAAELANRIGALTPDAAQEQLVVTKLLSSVVSQQALTLAFDDVFRLMSWMFLAALILVPFCRPVRPGAAPPAEAH